MEFTVTTRLSGGPKDVVQNSKAKRCVKKEDLTDPTRLGQRLPDTCKVTTLNLAARFQQLLADCGSPQSNSIYIQSDKPDAMTINVEVTSTAMHVVGTSVGKWVSDTCTDAK